MVEKRKEYFKIPYMRLHRNDIGTVYDGANKLTDKQMEEIAKWMSESFMNEWADTLKAAVSDILNI